MCVPKSDTSINGASRFEDCLTQQVTLCRALETLADGLPSHVDTRAAAALTDALCATLQRCHRMEEVVVFPALLAANPDMQATIDRLRGEHVEDEDQAGEVRDAIAAFVLFQKRHDVEEIGYMLRGLFVSLRRHLAFDRDYILPLYRRSGVTAVIRNLPQPPAR